MSGWPARVIRFGPFELNVEKAELRKHGVRLRIHDQPFRILAALVENPGVTVTRQELIKHVWSSGTFVDFEHSLNAAVNRLRHVLSEVGIRLIQVAPICCGLALAFLDVGWTIRS